MRDARDNDYMSPAEASRIKGKVGFLLTTTYKRVGRAATQPLVQRTFQDKDMHFSSPMSHMLEFFEVLFPLVPPKLIDVFPCRAQSGRKPLIMYTDACFSDEFSGLGAVLILPTGRFAALECPRWIRKRLNRNAKTVINQLELLAVILANLTFYEWLIDERVIYFEDNTCALSAMINGYASKEDMARLTNMYHLQNFFMNVDAWHDWVPSAANIADVPSRPRYERGSHQDGWQPLWDLRAEEVPMKLPTEGQWDSLQRWCIEVCGASRSADGRPAPLGQRLEV